MSSINEKSLRGLVREILREQSEVAIPKNEWVLLSSGDPRRLSAQEELFDILQSTYASIGGHFKVQSPGDLERYKFWAVADIDEDPEIDVALFAKPDIGGTKMGAAANDGSSAAGAAYKEKSAELRQGGSLGGVSNWWGEVSGKPAYAMLRRGANAVEDEDKVMQLLDGDEVIWHGEHPDPDAPPVFKAVKGWYTKTFGSKKSTKIILGSPAL